MASKHDPAPHAGLAEMVAALPAVGAEALARARCDAEARPIAYPLGSGQGDEIGLRAGLRPMMRQLLPEPQLERERARFERLGLRTRVAPRRYARTRDGWDHADDPGEDGGRLALFVGRDDARLEAAIACDLEKTPDADRELGRLLGYPRCCVDAFVAAPPPRRNVAIERAALARTEGPARARLNGADLGVFHFVGWYPCSYACALSLAYADALAERVARLDAPFVAAIDRALAAHRLLLTDDVQVSFVGRRDGRAITVEDAWPTARDRHPHAGLEPLPLEAAARATAAIRAARTLLVDDDALHLDGRAIRLPSPPLLLPFGDPAATRSLRAGPSGRP